MKLTKPQRELLEFICGSSHGRLVSASYKPAQKLVELGLATLTESPSGLGNPRLSATKAGRDAVK